MFEGVYPDRMRWRAVDDPMVPPPPTTMTLVVARRLAISLGGLKRLNPFAEYRKKKMASLIEVFGSVMSLEIMNMCRDHL